MRRTILILYALAGIMLLVALLRLCVGQTLGWPGGSLVATIREPLTTPHDPAQSRSTEQWILQLRLNRAILGAMVGAALAVSGVALQALLRNPLAEPYILGLSSGAAVGVMVQMLLSYVLHLSFGANHLGAVLGATLSMLVVFSASRRRGVIDPLGLLLVGVVLSTINGAIIMLVNYLVGPAGLREDLFRWMMGYLNEGVSSSAIATVGLVSFAGFLLLIQQARAMDVASFSDTEAASLGVNLPRLRVMLFLVASVLAAGAVVLAGPIAFVGLICPHLARMLLGPSHRPLLIGSALLGATLVMLADTAAVLLDFGQGLMPIGIFTAFLGGPAFLFMLRPQLGRGSE